MSVEQIDRFLNETRVAVISTVDADGRPRATPIWFQWEGGAAYLFTARSSLKWRNIERHPYASLCVDRREPPYAVVTLDGRIEESDRSLYELVLAMALRYYGEQRGREFAEQYREADGVVAFRLVPERLHAWDGRDEQ